LGFLFAFVKNVFSRMARAGACGECSDAGGFVATVFAVVVWHGSDVMVFECRYDVENPSGRSRSKAVRHVLFFDFW
jgi:hypothetical protein